VGGVVGDSETVADPLNAKLSRQQYSQLGLYFAKRTIGKTYSYPYSYSSYSP
jgi:hypothetical protein